jgi:hypothetical protein
VWWCIVDTGEGQAGGLAGRLRAGQVRVNKIDFGASAPLPVPEVGVIGVSSMLRMRRIWAGAGHVAAALAVEDHLNALRCVITLLDELT